MHTRHRLLRRKKTHSLVIWICPHPRRYFFISTFLKFCLPQKGPWYAGPKKRPPIYRIKNMNGRIHIVPHRIYADSVLYHQRLCMPIKGRYLSTDKKRSRRKPHLRIYKKKGGEKKICSKGGVGGMAGAASRSIGFELWPKMSGKRGKIIMNDPRGDKWGPTTLGRIPKKFISRNPSDEIWHTACICLHEQLWHGCDA